MQTDLLVGEEGGRLEGLEVGVVGRLKNYLYKKIVQGSIEAH